MARQLQRGESVSVAIPGIALQAGTVIEDDGGRFVQVWIGSRPRTVRRDQINTERRATPIRRYEDLFSREDD